MAFWGAEVKPKKPFTLKFSDFHSPKLHLSQATLGSKKSDDRVIVKCTVGDASAVYLCSLLPGAMETCSLNLYFDDDVTFSVKGSSSVHLAGYFDGNFDGDEPGEDVEDDGYSDEDYVEESEDNSLDSFINDDDEEDGDDYYYEDEWSSEEDDTIRVPNSGVIIEEVTDDVLDKPANQLSLVPVKETIQKQKQEQANGLNNGTAQSPEETNPEEADKPASSMEDEDGFCLNRKRKVNEPDHVKPSKKKSSKMEKEITEASSNKQTANADAKACRKKKKKKKDKSGSNALPMQQSNCVGEMQEMSKTPAKQENANRKDSIVKNSTSKKLGTNKNDPSTHKKWTVSKYPNGLEVQNTAMGKPDGKQATRGKKVGDKRRLTIPPDMGYGSKGGAGIPPNSWLVFDIELVEVK